MEECKDCTVLLFDDSAAVNIDACEGCRVFVGPCASSLFVRECRNCDIVCAVQQFRTRDCKDVRVNLFTQTEPIIETSSRITIGCFALAYFDLEAQFERANLSIWNNRWSEVHDFNAGAGGGGGNWKVADEGSGEDAAAMLRLTDEQKAEASIVEQPIVPRTYGVARRKLGAEQCFVCFAPGAARAARPVHDAMVARADTRVVRTREFRLEDAQAKVLFTKDAKLKAAAKTGNVVALEFNGPGAAAALAELVATHASGAGNAFLPAPGAATATACQQVFVDWKDAV